MSDYSKKKIYLISEFYNQFGEQKTLETFNIKPESLSRILRHYKNDYKEKEKFENLKLLRDIESRYTKKELQNLASGMNVQKEKFKLVPFSFEGNHIRFAAISDTQFGSIYFSEQIWEKVIKEIHNQKCEFITHGGDVVDGMFSKHEGQIYELNRIGYDAQKEYAIEMLSMLKKPIYVIDGNHDRTFQKKDGANIVKSISKEIKDCYYLGSDEGFLPLEKIKIELWHGEDGNSYALSYRVQKIVEAMTGGQKPDVLLCGHTHKSFFSQIRHIQCISTGAVCMQSKWMRSKRIENHTGFWIIDLWVNKTRHGIAKISPTWYPCYN